MRVKFQVRVKLEGGLNLQGYGISTYQIKLSDNSNLNNILNDLIIDESYKIYELK